MSFKQFLVEREMPISQAFNIFGITSVPPQDELKQIYKNLSKENHPDRGGSTEVMQDINGAYSVLKKYKSTSVSSINWDDIDLKYRELGKVIKDDLIKSFDPSIFAKYFTELSGKDFISVITSTSPDEKAKSPYSAGLTAEIKTDDGETIFRFTLHTVLPNVIRDTNGLASGDVMSDIKFDLSITTSVFHNNKVHKITQKSYNYTNDHSFFKDPSKLFPGAKVKKILGGETSKRKFSKRDMFGILREKGDVSVDGNDVYIKFGEDYKLHLYRLTMSRTPFWSIGGIYKRYSRIVMPKSHFLTESEKTALGLVELAKKLEKTKENKMEKLLNDFAEDNKLT
jgi:hypothetical protein